ncbi:MAG: fluoride efflux transporter CrcB [Bacillota bacterium]|nr:fluoride efflux transporter CrcB [Bacillota bacterium]
MKNYFYISIGAFAGAILRYLVRSVHIFSFHTSFPLNTLIINMLGSFFLALILTLPFEVWKLGNEMKLGLTTGFLGAFTTFSTLCRESAELMRHGDYNTAFSYIVLSALLGLGSAYLGIIAAEMVGNKIKKAERDVK